MRQRFDEVNILGLIRTHAEFCVVLGDTIAARKYSYFKHYTETAYVPGVRENNWAIMWFAMAYLLPVIPEDVMHKTTAEFKQAWLGRKIVCEPITGRTPHKIVDMRFSARDWWVFTLEGGNQVGVDIRSGLLGARIEVLTDEYTAPKLLAINLYGFQHRESA